MLPRVLSAGVTDARQVVAVSLGCLAIALTIQAAGCCWARQPTGVSAEDPVAAFAAVASRGSTTDSA